MEVDSARETHTTIDCREDEGQLRDTIRANNRSLFWGNICSELIDNALEHSGDSCNISLTWRQTKAGLTFRAVDDGFGLNELEAFFKPGKSVQTGRASGNSTFGMGLFVCECCLSSPESGGQLKVATCTGGSEILAGFRSVEKTMKVDKVVVSANDENRRAYSIGYRGTSITFNRCSKPQPNAKQFATVVEKLSKQYATSIAQGLLTVTLVRDNEETVVPPEAIPECVELKTAILSADGHLFNVEWGVTTGNCKDSGCRMIYGGKFFDVTTEPCGEYRVGRFYGAIRVPRTIGKESMDILKRNIDHSSLDSLFEQCRELFRPELEESDAICRKDENQEQTARIANMLSSAIKGAKASDSNGDPDETTEGDEDIRQFNGRDEDGEGVDPVGTGRKRKGRKSKRKGPSVPDAIAIFWAHLGEDKGMVLYQHDGFRVTFNLDAPIVIALRDSKTDDMVLSAIAAGHIAKDIAGTEKQKQFGFGDSDFAWIYRTMVERVQRVATV